MEETLNRSVWTPVRKRSLAAAALIVIVAIVGGVRWKIRSTVPTTDKRVLVGRQMPTFMVRDAAQKQVDLRDVKPGTRKVFVFYAPSCEVCKQELPALLPFPSNLEVVMVNESHTAGEADPYVARTPGAHRFTDPDSSFKGAFKVPSLPTVLFVDEKGIVVDGLVGAHPPTVAKSKLDKFMRGRA